MWTAENIINIIKVNDDQLCKALVRIYEKQTVDEQRDQVTKHVNGVGFAGPDAKILSSFAQQYKKKGWLSDKQKNLARARMLKYGKQLAKIANGEI